MQSFEGKGTCFDLYFPVTRRRHKTEKQVQVADYRRTGQTILVVDDIKEQRQIASDILIELGYQVHTASSGEAALEFLKSHHIDILLLDMIMEPGMDGLDTCRHLVCIQPGLRAVIASGYSETDWVRKTQELGAGIYLRKPYTMGNLAQAINHELNQPDLNN